MGPGLYSGIGKKARGTCMIRDFSFVSFCFWFCSSFADFFFFFEISVQIFFTRTTRRTRSSLSLPILWMELYVLWSASFFLGLAKMVLIFISWLHLLRVLVFFFFFCFQDSAIWFSCIYCFSLYSWLDSCVFSVVLFLLLFVVIAYSV